MDDIFLLTFLLSIVGLVIGIIKPSIIKLNSRKTAIKIFVSTLFISFVLFGITTDTTDQSIEPTDSEEQIDSEKTEKSSEESTEPSNQGNEDEHQMKQDGTSNSSDDQNKQSNKESENESTENGERSTKTENPSEDGTNQSNTTTSNKEQSSNDQTSREADDFDNANLPLASVTRIVDGDTIEINLNGKIEDVRLLLVDTPETKHPSKPVQPLGPEASAFAKEKLSGKQVRVEYDGPKQDKYGRLLAYLWVDGQNFNQMLLEEGLARLAYVYDPPYTHYDAFVKAQTKAVNAGIGIWSIGGYVQSDGFYYEETDEGKSQENQQEKDFSNEVSSSYDGPYDPHGDDRDCGDFNTHDDAQAFFEAAGGPKVDPHRLDRDGNGLACESLP